LVETRAFLYKITLYCSLLLLLSLVRGSMTNNDGFWIGWLDLLAPCVTVTFNYTQLQQLTINDSLRLAPFWLDYHLSSLLVFLLLGLTWYWFTKDLRITKDEWWMKNESVLLCMAACIVSGNHGERLLLVRWHGNAFPTKSVSRNPHLRRNMC
jgi:hypothetical protein